MAVDRDLEVAILRAAGSEVDGAAWELASATGVRGLRALVEGGRFAGIRLSESHPAAFEVLERNASRYAELGATAVQEDATAASHVGRCRFVDIDPYGTPVPFLGAALASIDPPGTLAVTATDLRVLAGAEAGAAERRYGGAPIRGRLGPEAGLRLLLATIARNGAEIGLRTHPMVAYVRDHHVRAYVRLENGPPAAESVSTIEPSEWTGPSLPRGGPFGPMWLGPLLDRSLIDRLVPPPIPAEPRRVTEWIDRLKEESACDVPFFFESNTLAAGGSLDAPPRVDALVASLRAAGHPAARAAVRPGAFRTTATRREVLEIARSLPQSQNDRVRA